MSNRIEQFLKELHRRRVLRVAAVYIGAVWLIAAGGADLFEAFGVPDWGLRMFVLIAILALPVVLILTWMFQFTTSGLIRDHGSEAEPTRVSALAVGDAPPPLDVAWSDSSETSRTGRFSARFCIGRDSRCEVRLSDVAVSRTHAEIYPENGVWWIRDLGSTNGTYVNEERIENVPLPRQAIVRCAAEGPELCIQTADSAETTRFMPAVPD